MIISKRVNGKQKYIRPCPNCSTVITTGYKPKEDTLCRGCTNIEAGKVMAKSNEKPETEHKRYWLFCSNCPDIRLAKAPRRFSWCADCSRKLSKQKTEVKTIDIGEGILVNVRFKVPKIRYLRICPECPEESNTIETTKRYCGIRVCKECLKKKEPVKPKTIVKKKKRKRTYKQVGVDGQQKVNVPRLKLEFQTVNLTLNDEGEPIELIADQDTRTDKEKDDAMIAEFLAKRGDK